MKRLFVAMPYGTREAPLDFESPKDTAHIDFDAVWAEILQPSIPTNFTTKRADELRQPGLIDRMYNEWLFDADIVLADLTFGNPNVYYELGIRQALSKKGTVLVACKGTKLPFDVRNQYVIHYDYFAAPSLRSFQAELRQAIENASVQILDSPVHVFLPGLYVGRCLDGKLPEVTIQELRERVREMEAGLDNQRSRDEEERLLEKVMEASTPPRVLSVFSLVNARSVSSLRLLERLAIRLRDFGYFDEALEVLKRALELGPDDPELLRETGFVYRKKGPAFYGEAESFLKRALKQNDDDSELHGMLGGLLRRRGEYDKALSHYKRAHTLQPNDLYPLITTAAMCAATGKVNEAKDYYHKIRSFCEELVRNQNADHWTFLCLGESEVALSDSKAAIAAYQKALDADPPVEHVRSEVEQLEFLIERNFANDDVEKVLPMLLGYLRARDPS